MISVYKCTLCGHLAYSQTDAGAHLKEAHPGTEARMELVRYRCRVGHAYSAESMEEEQGRAAEAALWTALRALEERVGLLDRLLERASHYGQKLASSRFAAQRVEANQAAEVIRQLLAQKV